MLVPVNCEELDQQTDVISSNEVDWRSMINEFESLVNVSDGLEMTKLVRDHMARFLEISMPVGGLFAAAVLNGPNSSEQRLINDLTIEMKKGFESTQKKIKHAFNAINVDFSDFYEHIFIILKRCLKMDPDYTNKYDNEIIKWKSFLRSILLTKVERKSDASLDFEFDKCSKKISGMLALMSDKHLAAALEKTKKMVTSNVEFKTIRLACDAVISVVNDFPAFTDIFKHRDGFVTYGVFCSNLTYADDPERYSWYNASLKTESEDILNWLLDWITKNLERSWPDFERQIVLDTIQKDMEHQIYVKENYPAINKKIISKLQDYGPKGYIKQIVTHSGLPTWRYLYLCPIKKCLTVVDVKGANFVVVRFKKSESGRIKDAQHWLTERRSLINETLLQFLNFVFDKKSICARRETPLSSFDGHFFRQFLV
uniref:Uncharacterized protein n=1 Tax=Panagrolaimus sp. JU765 TaxID=591449 RepID=A0AC34RG79_9BILA